jgi:hypothetical protein
MLQGAISSLCVYLGHELGLYKTLKSLGPSSPQQLASAAGLSERWVTEWLYQQSASRLVCCDSEAKRCVCVWMDLGGSGNVGDQIWAWTCSPVACMQVHTPV